MAKITPNLIRKRSIATASASVSIYEEFGVYSESGSLGSLSSDTSAHRKRFRKKWIPRGRSSLNPDGSLEIEFLNPAR
jgi:hypothetical protein